jgi:hypothetical protein
MRMVGHLGSEVEDSGRRERSQVGSKVLSVHIRLEDTNGTRERLWRRGRQGRARASRRREEGERTDTADQADREGWGWDGMRRGGGSEVRLWGCGVLV